MPTNIVVPELGESVVEATVARWLKKEGDPVAIGEAVVELETEKVDLEVGASHAGVLSSIAQPEGADVKIGELLGVIDESAPATTTPVEPQPEREARRHVGSDDDATPTSEGRGRVAAPARTTRQLAPPAGPAVSSPESERAVPPSHTSAFSDRRELETRVRLSRRRQTIARRLVEAQRTAAMLTTFNEVDMTELMAIRRRHKEAFRERHGVGLGISSFFVRAVVSALMAYPRLNAEVQDDEMVLKQYYDVGVAVGASEGLVVPVLREADRMSFADIERGIKTFAQNAEAGSLTFDDLKGGTFTITNGGVFGSLMSTPILNPPQVGILGLHKIEDRAVPRNGQIAIRPMMYLALSYDHRIVDGREAVQFLVHVKTLIEDPAGILFQ